MTQKLQGYGQPQDWDDETYYPIGQTAAHNGSIWRAVTQNRNSEPEIGNSDWTLVSGTPFVDVTLDPVALTTAPFFDPAETGPGVEIVSAPGVGLWAVPVSYTTQPSAGDPWGDDANAMITYGSVVSGSSFAMSDNLREVGIQPNLGVVTGTALPPYENLALVIHTATDITDNGGGPGSQIGSRSLTLRLYYRIEPVAASTPAFFTISAVDQGAKTFTVNGDAVSVVVTTFSVVGSTGNDGDYTVVSTVFTTSGTGTTDAIGAVSQLDQTFTITGADKTAAYPAGSITTVAGSTGNDGDYTVVSAVLDTGDTVITVVEAIPDATADGTLEEPSVTEIVTVQAIPDATADGWVEQA